MPERVISAGMARSYDDRLSCPRCGWEVTDLLCAHPSGFATAVAIAIQSGLVCCGHKPTLEETKVWARIVYAERSITEVT